ncbi:MAG TPA: sugar diacid recognition domain-containing protein [Symbiobacteriaceae bacterium]|jgi:carbohydrate diacid regulator|nr:sugar diacid recognition domain-containing protein [Symbiobacteriaceae bacterium]
MQLTTELAAPIVERAMAIIQRNVNMMDADGYIVGSGDPERVGSFHKGALAVLQTGRRVEIYPEDAQWEGVRPGVNLPLRLGGQIVGVVGMTGPPEEVRPFGELLREMVQLMLAQARTAELERATALAREACLRDLLTGGGDVSERLIREARLMGLEEGASYRVLLCEQAGAEPGHYAWVEGLTDRVEAAARNCRVEPLLVTGPWEGRLVLVAGDPEGRLAADIHRNAGDGVAVAAGLSESGLAGLSRSYRTALLALTAGRRLERAGPYTAEALGLETLLSTLEPDAAARFLRGVLGGLPPVTNRQGAALRETLRAYLRSGMSLAAAANDLGIHRHTLTYRLEQVAAATQLDPRTWDGALRLYLGLLVEQLIGLNVQSKP